MSQCVWRKSCQPLEFLLEPTPFPLLVSSHHRTFSLAVTKPFTLSWPLYYQSLYVSFYYKFNIKPKVVETIYWPTPGLAKTGTTLLSRSSMDWSAYCPSIRVICGELRSQKVWRIHTSLTFSMDRDEDLERYLSGEPDLHPELSERLQCLAAMIK